jgi:hypothetical protein
VKIITIVNKGQKEKVTALKIRKQCPLVLLIKVGWRKGNEDGRVVRSVLLEVCSIGKNLSILSEFAV